MKTSKLDDKKILVTGTNKRIAFKKTYIYEVLEVNRNESNLFISITNARKYLNARGYKYFQGKDTKSETYMAETNKEFSFFFESKNKKEIAYLKAIEIFS